MPWVLDQKHSHVGFAVQHMMFTCVRGVFHRYSGKIAINEQDLTRSQFSGEIEVASIDTHVTERDEHLRSADFFDATRFPLITYQSTRMEALGGNMFRVFGDLTIHGVTHEVVIEGEYAGQAIKDPWGAMRTGFTGHGTLDRRDFGLEWNQVLETGGVVVAHMVDLQLDIELVQQAEA